MKNNTLVAQKPTEDNSTTTNYSLFGYNNSQGAKIEFVIGNESLSTVNLDQSHPFTSQSQNLIIKSRKVRKQSPFGNLNFDELQKKYSFVPFPYQRANVETLLNHFNGKGVLGDQVGLGKTVEALMAAHAMFESGSIRNAFIIVPKNTLESWVCEIQEKFPSIFKIHCLNELPNGKYGDIKVYDNLDNLLTAVVENNGMETADFNLYITTIENFYRNRDMIGTKEQEYRSLRALDNWLSVEDKHRISTELSDIIEGIKKPNSIIDLRILNSFDYSGVDDREWLIRVLNGFLEKLKDKLRNNDDRNLSNAVETVTQKIDELNDETHKKSKVKLDKLTQYGQFIGNVGNRLIDLLIVDEVHTLYPIEDTKRKDGEIYQHFISLSDIEKKYCILLSATPVRTTIEDIFHLIYILDKNVFGMDGQYHKSKEYFFKVMCRIAPETPYKLQALLSDPDGKNSFFGLVNNYFTRQRIFGVTDQMKGSSVSSSAKEYVFNNYQKNLRIIRQRLGNPELYQNSPQLHESIDKTATNLALIEACRTDPDNRKRRELHAFVDWRRPEKEGILIVPDEEFSKYSIADQIINLYDYTNSMPDHTVDLSEYRTALTRSSVICYISSNEDSRKAISTELQRNWTKRKILLAKTADDVPSPTEGNHNPFVIVGSNFQAGVNLQQYDTFIFTQMDHKKSRLLEPVDIEQWIGRIHRTGQPLKCRIITILAAYTSTKYDKEFLEWYYDIMADKEGLDLYGNTTPDIAFLQPVIVDFIKSKLSINYDSFSRLLWECYNRDKNENNDNLKDYVRQTIRDLCKIPDFGKPQSNE